MILGRCPICHSRLQLEALVQDDAGRELLGLLASLDQETGRALVVYLGLFRSGNRDLANDRALRLARGALALCEQHGDGRLAAAMAATAESIRRKPGSPPLSDHHYLKKVLANLPEPALQPASTSTSSETAAKSKTLGAVAALQQLKR